MTIHAFLQEVERRIERAGVMVYLTLDEAGRLHDYAGFWGVGVWTIKNGMQGYIRSDAKKLLEKAKAVLASRIADELEQMK
jgi:hypothetical protein